MSIGQFTNTSSHMVQEVINIIDGYKMGALRALAQEPVQNALDAVRRGCKTVEVEYRLLRRVSDSGESCFLLTVTDSGTTGLRGPLVNAQELQQRNYQLKPEENWAAFEAQGYTKENEDALGSRGQGKSAFLYHSHVPGDTRRMLMLYDSLLEDGEYRLGMRFARPVDQVMAPPLYGEEARQAIRSADYSIDGDMTVPLGLEPLRDIGTRIIVPYLDHDVVDAIRPGGELASWLERCWWRAIQLGRLSIRVVDDTSGEREEIAVPSWWQGMPRIKGKPSKKGRWFDSHNGRRSCEWRDLPFGDEHRIRRLVMLHSDTLEADELSNEPEWAGIQLLRGSQWIETRGARQDYGDLVPRDKRTGFRGYVEFDKSTDSMLRAAEYSQHDGFDARGKKGEIVRALRRKLDEIVREFSDGMGWESSPSRDSQQATRREKTTHARLLETFLSPKARKANSLKPGEAPDSDKLLWDCRLDLEYPDPKSARFDWGQSISRVYVEVGAEPSEALNGSADLILEWVDDAGKAQELRRFQEAITRQWNTDRVYRQFELGDWQVLRGRARREQQIECPAPGQCRLRAVVEHRGERVKSAARAVYVECEPPPPPEQRPVTLSISAKNVSVKNQKRIDHGQVLMIHISARNRRPDADTLYLRATFADEVLARHEQVELSGTPAGDTPYKHPILTIKRQLLDPLQSAPSKVDDVQSMIMDDSSGIYHVRAELVDKHGEFVAAASERVYFQRDPGKAVNKMPFDIEQKAQIPMWELNEDLTILSYCGEHPLYKELPYPQRQHRSLHGRLAFIAEISANGLLEWALRPKEHGDDSHYDHLYDEGRGDGMWDAFNRGLENLSQTAESPIRFSKAWRETVAIMLSIFAQEND